MGESLDVEVILKDLGYSRVPRSTYVTICNAPDFAYWETDLIVRTVDLVLLLSPTSSSTDSQAYRTTHFSTSYDRQNYPLPNKIIRFIMLATRRLTFGHRRLLSRPSFFSSSAIKMVYVPSYLFGQQLAHIFLVFQ